jgi:hypothetical protein
MNTFSKSLTFLSFVLLFTSCRDLETTPSIEYGERGLYGPNILDITRLEYTTQENSLQCKIPSGHLLSIKITAKKFNDTGLIPKGIWQYEPASLDNWTATDFDYTTNSQMFSSIDPGRAADGKLVFDEGTFQIDYFENGSPAPTMTRTVEVDF